MASCSQLFVVNEIFILSHSECPKIIDYKTDKYFRKWVEQCLGQEIRSLEVKEKLAKGVGAEMWQEKKMRY